MGRKGVDEAQAPGVAVKWMRLFALRRRGAEMTDQSGSGRDPKPVSPIDAGDPLPRFSALRQIRMTQF